MKLYDYMATNRAVSTITAYAVPTTFPTVSNEVTLANAPAGEYLLSYNFEVDFGAHKDVYIEFIGIINGVDGDTFAESIPVSNLSSNKNRLYGRRHDHVSGDIVVGIKFQDAGDDGLIIDHCDVSITRIG